MEDRARLRERHSSAMVRDRGAPLRGPRLRNPRWPEAVGRRRQVPYIAACAAHRLWVLDYWWVLPRPDGAIRGRVRLLHLEAARLGLLEPSLRVLLLSPDFILLRLLLPLLLLHLLLDPPQLLLLLGHLLLFDLT